MVWPGGELSSWKRFAHVSSRVSEGAVHGIVHVFCFFVCRLFLAASVCGDGEAGRRLTCVTTQALYLQHLVLHLQRAEFAVGVLLLEQTRQPFSD